MFNEGNQIHNFMSSSGSGTVINYSSGSGSDFLKSYGSGYGSGSTSQKVTVPVPQHCKLQITLVCHNARQSLKYHFLSDPSHFSLPKQQKASFVKSTHFLSKNRVSF